MKLKFPIITLLLSLLIFVSCEKEMIDAPENEFLYEVKALEGDSQTTEAQKTECLNLAEKIFLDRHIMNAGDSIVTCASCHITKNAAARLLPLDSNNKELKNPEYFVSSNAGNSAAYTTHCPLMNDADLKAMAEKMQQDPAYIEQFRKVFGDRRITPALIFKAAVRYHRHLQEEPVKGH